MSSAAVLALTCSVCDKPAETRCSGCGVPYYCSRTCQGYVWSVHKFSCQQDDVGRRTFSFPPLTAEEADYFRILPSGGVVHTLSIVGEEDEEEDWIRAVTRAGWYPEDPRETDTLELTRANLLRDLQKAKGDSIPEPERTYILALLGCQYYVHLRDTDTNPDLNDPGCTPFQITAADAWSVICGAYRAGGLTPDFLSKHFEYFQRLLVFHCTGLTGKIPNRIRGDYVTATSRRLSACVDDLDVNPRIREIFRKRADACARTADQSCTVM